MLCASFAFLFIQCHLNVSGNINKKTNSSFSVVLHLCKFFYRYVFCTTAKKAPHILTIPVIKYLCYWSCTFRNVETYRSKEAFLPGICMSHWALQNSRVKVRLLHCYTPSESRSFLHRRSCYDSAAGCTVTAGFRSSWLGVIQKYLLNHYRILNCILCDAITKLFLFQVSSENGWNSWCALDMLPEHVKTVFSSLHLQTENTLQSVRSNITEINESHRWNSKFCVDFPFTALGPKSVTINEFHVRTRHIKQYMKNI